MLICFENDFLLDWFRPLVDWDPIPNALHWDGLTKIYFCSYSRWVLDVKSFRTVIATLVAAN